MNTLMLQCSLLFGQQIQIRQTQVWVLDAYSFQELQMFLQIYSEGHNHLEQIIFFKALSFKKLYKQIKI